MRQVDNSLSELAFRADAGDGDAQYRMATLFLLGEEVEQDLNASYLWMARAAAGQHPGAQGLLEKLALCRNVPGRDDKRVPLSKSFAATRLSIATALQSAAASCIALVGTIVRLSENRARRVAARVRFTAAADVTDFPARRSEGFEYHEAS
jgi:TPR repeat protein